MDKVHIGTMGWSYNFWVGNFYPEALSPENFLSEYSNHFDTVEVDSTFYRIPSKTTTMKWRDQTPHGFLFSAKFPKVITHEKMLRNCERELERFIEAISALQGKVGPLLLQFPSWLKPDSIHVLSDFLAGLPKRYRFVVEVRNSKTLVNDLYSTLRDNGVSLALVDHPFLPTTGELTADFVYIRWEGDGRKVKGNLGRVEVDRTSDNRKWADKIKTFLDASIEVFGYFSKYYSGYPPNDAKQLLKYLHPTTSAQDHARNDSSVRREVATLGGGCFWCTEAVFNELEGVKKVEPGYSGGSKANPTYEQVSTGKTGHAEVVQVTFDPEAISYKEILEVFFSTHDPTTLNRQGPDVGIQYRSVIFYHSDEQRTTAEKLIKELNEAKVWNAPIVTRVEPFKVFFKAEDYHKDYFERHSEQPYCQLVIAPKIAKLRKHYRDKLKKK